MVVPGCHLVQLDAMLTALYHDRSGMTHLLAAPLPELLAAMAQPVDVAAILVGMAITDDDQARDLLLARIAELHAIGAIRSA